MSAFDEVRVAYTDDRDRRNLLGQSLTRRELIVAQERALAVVVMEDRLEVPVVKGYRPGDPVQLRGIPMVGVYGGMGGAVRGSRPHVDGIR